MKKIGIPGWVVDSKVFGITLPYAEFIQRFGSMQILTNLEGYRNDLDLLILPGGADIISNDVPSFYTGQHNPQLEYFDKNILPEYLNKGQKILSICRGAQRLWVNFGGQLIQHNYWHDQSSHPKDECHFLEWGSVKYSNSYSHLIEKVNSRHHQTMSAQQYIPDNIDVIAYAKETVGKQSVVYKDIVEIWKHNTLPIYGIQGHPEDMPNDKFTPKIISELLNI